MAGREDPCVVVGAGPVGQTAALALRRRGIRTLVVEAEPAGRARPGSRAIFLMTPTLQRFDQVLPGLGAKIAADGIQVGGYDAFYGDRRVCHLSMPSASPLSVFGLGASLPQRVTETHLYDAAVEHGVEFRWSSPVAGVVTDAGGATVTLDSGEEIRAPYVIAADGARSVVRSALGLSLAGDRDDTPFIIVDVDAHPDGSTARMPGRFHYRYPRLDGRNVMHMPFAGGMRIDLQCLPGDDVAYLESADGVREWVSQTVDPWYGEHVAWVSTYRFHQAVADSYTDRHHRVLLAGEAAHLFAPWGGRGLNSGVIDATDAATAIADARSTQDPAVASRAIARCAADRRTWGLHNRDVSSRALRRMRASDPFMRWQRDIAARLAPLVWPAGAWLANGPTQVPVPRLTRSAVGWY